MNEMFSNPGVVAVFMAMAIPIVAIVVSTWAEVTKNRDNAELKKSMIDRGMSAEEIQQVIHAGTKKEKK